MSYLIFVKDKKTYSGTQMLPLERPEYNVRYAVPYRMDKFDVNVCPIVDSCRVFEVVQEGECNALCEYLASIYPTQEIVRAKIDNIWQSERPTIKRKQVSEKGTLPV